MEASSRFLDTKLINRHKDALNSNNINVDSIQSILFNCENNIVVQYI